MISGSDEKYLAGFGPEKKSQLRVVHELVSGLLDLDRVDHYRRDNYFMGLHSGIGLNYLGLLGGMTLFYDPGNADRDPVLRLSQSAIGHAICLLQNKERLSEDCFEHPDNVAYEAMLHVAWNMFFLGDDFYRTEGIPSEMKPSPDKVFDFLVAGDDELLFALRSSGSTSVRSVIDRILNRRPFVMAGKLLFSAGHRLQPGRIRHDVSSIAGLAPDRVVVRVFRRFGRGKLQDRNSEWLDLARLEHTGGKPLEQTRFRRQIEHFKQAQDAPHEPLWIYGLTEQDAERVHGAIGRICDRLPCTEEKSE